MICPNCNYASPPGMKFCGMCGLQLAWLCAACSSMNPPDFRFCGHCGAQREVAPAAQPTLDTVDGVAQLKGERRYATIVMADVFGSTELLERVGTETWVALMNRVFQLLEAEIYRFGGQVDQFRGDGLVAFFGARAAHEDDPERAVLAGMAMQSALHAYAAELQAQRGIELRVRVGINTGEVVVTSVGDRERHSENTAMGEAITIAARMESAAAPGSVLVSANTYTLVETCFEWEALGEIQVKGVSQPIAVYHPLRHLPDFQELHNFPDYGFAAQLIGREAEFQALSRSVATLRQERGGIVLLMGDRGMGKSFLMRQVRQNFLREEALRAEVHAQTPHTPGARPIVWLRGRGRSYDQSQPYSLWLDVFREWFDMRADEPQEAALARLRRRAEGVWGPKAQEYFPGLAAALSLPLEEESLAQVRAPATGAPTTGALDGDRSRQLVFQMTYHWLEALTQQGPLVISFADAHWADVSSIDLLKRCLPLCERLPLLWIVVLRPDRASPVWEFRHYVETEYPHRLTMLSLPPFSREQSEKFTDTLLGEEVLPPETRAMLLDKAEGNPYYIVEMLRELAAQGVLQRDAETGAWRATRPVDSLELPESLHSLLLARLDDLRPETRRVLQIAAAIGQTFWADVLETLADCVSPTAFQAALTEMQRAQLVFERGRTPELGMAYNFKSSLICDAVYESILSPQRVAYHLRIARYFQEHLDADNLLRHAGMLAYHYHQAGELQQELTYTFKAARQAKQVYANAEAMAHYSHALTLLDALEAEPHPADVRYALRRRRFAAIVERGEISQLTGDDDAWRAETPQLLPLARVLDQDPELLVDALLAQPGVSSWRTEEEFRAGIPLAEEALALARQLGDRPREMYSLAAVCGHRYNLNDPAWFELSEETLALAREVGDQRFEVRMLAGVGGVLASRNAERSLDYLRRALPISQQLNDKQTELDLLNLLGVHLENGVDYYRRLTEVYEKQVQLAHDIGNRPAEGQALMFAGQVRSLYLGDYEGGLTLLKEAERIMQETGGELFVLLRMAQIQIVQGKLASAQLKLKRAHQVGDSSTYDLAQAGLCMLSAMLDNALGGAEAMQSALQWIAQGRAIVMANDELAEQYRMVMDFLEAGTYLEAAIFEDDPAQRQAHLEAALAASQTALATYEADGYVRPIETTGEEVLFVHNKILSALGRREEARHYLKRAHEELLRKHALIPETSAYRQMYLENIPVHREIRAAYALSAGQVRWDGARVTFQLEPPSD